MNFGEQNWGRADWGSDDGPIIHDISTQFITQQELSVRLSRYRGVVDLVETNWGRFNLGEANWGGVGDKVSIGNATALDVELRRYRSINTILATTSSVSSDIHRYRMLSSSLDTQTNLSATAYTYKGLVASLLTPQPLTVLVRRFRRPVAYLDTGSSLTTSIDRLRGLQATFTTSPELSVDIIRLLPASAEFTTESKLWALLYGAVQATLEYIVSLNPGESIVIDTEDLLATKGGDNARQNLNIDGWPRLQPGKNIFVYTDSETGRTIEIEIEKEDRSV